MPRLPKPKEKDVQGVILDWLAAIGIAAKRQNTGGRTDEYKGKRRYTPFGTPGQFDITGLIRRCDGRRLDIEVKREGENMNDAQRRFLSWALLNGGVAFCAHSLAECQARLREALGDAAWW